MDGNEVKGISKDFTREQVEALVDHYNMGASSEEAAQQEQQRINSGLEEYKLQLYKSGLCNYLNWTGEELERFRVMFQPLLEGTEYHLERSGEKTQVVYDLKRGYGSGRVLGFKVFQTEQIKGNGRGRVRAFFNHAVYLKVKALIGLPDNDLPKKTQDHVYITLEKFWDVICIITNNEDKLL